MRKFVPLVLLAVALGGCRQLGLKSSSKPAYGGSTTTSIWGNWVLQTPTDSTAFRGASAVEMQLDRGMFTIEATYPNRAPMRLTGTAQLDETGLLTLIPQSGAIEGVRSGALLLEVGKPYSMLATASGSTLVFAPATRTVPEPSSTWFRKDKAQQAGVAPKDSTKR